MNRPILAVATTLALLGSPLASRADAVAQAMDACVQAFVAANLPKEQRFVVDKENFALGPLDAQSRTYRIVLDCGDEKSYEKIQQALSVCSLRIYELRQIKTENTIVGRWHIVGAPKAHEKFALLMLQENDIKEFAY